MVDAVHRTAGQNHRLLRTVVLAGNSDYRLYRFRSALMHELLKQSSSVYAIAPKGRYVSELERMGVTFRHWRVRHESINPINDLWCLASMLRLMIAIRPTICHTFTPKPNIYGAIAARLAGVPVIVSSYTGLGYLFTEDKSKAVLIQRVVRPLMRLSSKLSDAVLFQNRDDMDQMVELGLTSKEKAHLIPGGSGVNTDEFSPARPQENGVERLRDELNVPDGSVVVLLAGRMLWNKGIGEYVACAQTVGERRSNIRFLLAGGMESKNPASIPRRVISQWDKEGWVNYLGHREDIPDLLRLADIVVLPSYREGIPRILIEASATGKPIVTTDAPGCRETVDHEVNGLLVPPRDVAGLTNAITRLADDPLLRARMSRASREKAVREFNERKVLDSIISLYRELLAKKLGTI